MRAKLTYGPTQENQWEGQDTYSIIDDGRGRIVVECGGEEVPCGDGRPKDNGHVGQPNWFFECCSAPGKIDDRLRVNCFVYRHSAQTMLLEILTCERWDIHIHWSTFGNRNNGMLAWIVHLIVHIVVCDLKAQLMVQAKVNGRFSIIPNINNQPYKMQCDDAIAHNAVSSHSWMLPVWMICKPPLVYECWRDMLLRVVCLPFCKTCSSIEYDARRCTGMTQWIKLNSTDC